MDRHSAARHSRGWKPWLLALVLAQSGAATTRAGAAANETGLLRATVQLRNGNGRGSGTVIASSAGETLIVTATHVVQGAKALQVEIHRHNLGSRIMELTEGGGWPRLVRAEIVVEDPDSDLALVRVRGMVALRYVARIDPKAVEPSKGDTMTSVGIDNTRRLTLWKTGVVGPAELDLKRGKGGGRKFTLTTRWPEHGRSGGGLFRTDGALVGVCTGQLRLGSAPRVGAFASVESLRALLATVEAVEANHTASPGC